MSQYFFGTERERDRQIDGFDRDLELKSFAFRWIFWLEFLGGFVTDSESSVGNCFLCNGML